MVGQTGGTLRGDAPNGISVLVKDECRSNLICSLNEDELNDINLRG